MVDVQELARICETALQAVGYELVDLEYVRDPQGWVLRVYIDQPFDEASGEGAPAEEAGSAAPPAGAAITHRDCELASRHLGTVLDVEDPIATAYRLEVSSPGLRRPVRRERDFRRFTGRRARVELHEALEGRKNFTGVLDGVGEGVVTMDVDGKSVRLPLAGIRRARLELDPDELEPARRRPSRRRPGPGSRSGSR